MLLEKHIILNHLFSKIIVRTELLNILNAEQLGFSFFSTFSY